mgnify:CR=1 FL=1|jgi:hypothetical protein
MSLNFLSQISLQVQMSSLTKATLKFDQGNRQTMFIPFVFVYIFSLLLLIICIY